MRETIFGLLIFLSTGLVAQSERTPMDRFFLGTASTFYIDFVTSPLSTERVRVGAQPDPNDPTQSIDVFAEVPKQTQYISYFSFGLEPRFNLKEFSDDIAFAVSAPVTIGFGQSFEANEDVLGNSGFGSIQLPVLAKIYLGAASTYRSNQDFGINLGAGFEVNKIGIVNFGSFEEANSNPAWIMPTVAGGIHFWRGNSPMEVNFKYGFGAKDTYRFDKFGTFLSAPRVTRASSIKLTFIYLTNF